MPSTAKELVTRWFEEVWNQRRDETMYELTHTHAVAHMDTKLALKGMDGFKEFRDNLLAAMPDIRVEIEDILVENDQAVARWYYRGIHSGHGLGFEPTRKLIEFRGMTWFRIQDNRFTEGWNSWNQGAVMQQLANVVSASQEK
ncbi:MAG: ester cyclase [Pirellulales bacterium]